MEEPAGPSGVGSWPDGQKIGSLVDQAIIPRLMLANRQASTASTADRAASLKELGLLVEDFARLSYKQDLETCIGYVNLLRERGHNLEDIMIHLIAPTARQLGSWWEADTIDFVDVTIGTSRLQQMIWRWSPRANPNTVAGERTALFLPTPGDQHTFGIVILSELFKKAGWAVTLGNSLEPAEVEELLTTRQWDIVGYSIANNRLIDTLRSAIERTRAEIGDGPTRIIVGGNSIAYSSIAAAELGADFVAKDATEALEFCEDQIRHA